MCCKAPREEDEDDMNLGDYEGAFPPSETDKYTNGEAAYYSWNDPRWKSYRREIYERDAFTCTKCHKKSGQLRGHHLAYVRKLSPWQYPACVVTTLCVECHDELHRQGLYPPEFGTMEEALEYVAMKKIANAPTSVVAPEASAPKAKAPTRHQSERNGPDTQCKVTITCDTEMDSIMRTLKEKTGLSASLIVRPLLYSLKKFWKRLLVCETEDDIKAVIEKHTAVIRGE